MKLFFALMILVLLNGCAVYDSHNLKVWVICYKDEGYILPNGMYESNILYYKCNTRKLIQFQYHIGSSQHPLVDFTKMNNDDL